jgi:hypothetical protein
VPHRDRTRFLTEVMNNISKVNKRRLQDASALIGWLVLYAALVWLVRLWPAADALRPDYQVLLGIVAAAILAVYALGFGSLFVTAEHFSSSRGARATLLLMLNPLIRNLVAGSVVLVLVTVAVAATVPRVGEAARIGIDLDAAAVALAALTAIIVAFATVSIARVFDKFSSPRGFGELIGDRISNARRADSLADLQKALRQWLCLSVNTGSSIDVERACDGYHELVARYLVITKGDRSQQETTSQNNDDEVGLETIGKDLVRACEVGILARAARRDLDRIANTLATSIEASMDVVPSVVADFVAGLTEMGCLSEQTDSNSLKGWFRKPAELLAEIHRDASANPAAQPVATAALLGWALVVWQNRDGKSRASFFESTLPESADSTAWEGARKQARDGVPAPMWLRVSDDANEEIVAILLAAQETRTIDQGPAEVWCVREPSF